MNLDIANDIVKNLLLYVVEWGICNLLVDGKVEAYSVIVNLDGVGFFKVPVDMLKDVVKALQSNYRGRMYKLYCFKTPIAIRAIYKMISPLLEKFTQEKINILGDDSKVILANIPESQVEKRFGGKANDCENILPPKY